VIEVKQRPSHNKIQKSFVILYFFAGLTLRHGAQLEESGGRVTRALVKELVERVVKEDKREEVTAHLFMDLVTKRDFPQFITTYLSESIVFQERHK
jgi:hypothetical protein